jgi:hypothetical protein
LYCTALHELHCTALVTLQCTALYCTALYCTALYCTALHCTKASHCAIQIRSQFLLPRDSHFPRDFQPTIEYILSDQLPTKYVSQLLRRAFLGNAKGQRKNILPACNKLSLLPAAHPNSAEVAPQPLGRAHRCTLLSTASCHPPVHPPPPGPSRRTPAAPV